jgi:hypothetical protein
MIVIGQPLIELARGLAKDSTGGLATVYRWRGTRASCEGLFQQILGQFDNVELDPVEGDWCEVRAFNNGPEDGQEETATTTLEMRCSLVQQSIELAPYFSDLNYSEVSFVRAAIQDNKNSAEFLVEYTDASDDEPTVYRSSSFNLADELFSKLRIGDDTHEIATNYFTRTRNVSSGYPTAIILTNLNKLWTPDQMSAYIGSPTLFALGTLSPTARQTALGYAFRWKQQQAEAIITSGGGWQLIEGWQSGFWDTRRYASAS